MRRASSLFAVFVTLAACGDDAPRADGSSEGTPPEAAAFISELCTLYEPCCATGASSRDKCIEAMNAVAANRTFDTARAWACLQAIREESKRPTFCFRAPTGVTCAAVFKHPRALQPGAGCTKSSDCANGADGSSDALCGNGKCRHVTRGKEGDTCIGTRIAGATDEVTKPPEGTVALCGAGEGLYCAESTTKCTKRGDVRGTCEGSDSSCVDSAWCPTTTSQCVERTPSGQSCTDAFECATGDVCANDDEGGGACTALLAEGGSCERGDECDPSLVCDSSSKCVKDAEQYALACTGGLVLSEPL